MKKKLPTYIKIFERKVLFLSLRESSLTMLTSYLRRKVYWTRFPREIAFSVSLSCSGHAQSSWFLKDLSFLKQAVNLLTSSTSKKMQNTVSSDDFLPKI